LRQQKYKRPLRLVASIKDKPTALARLGMFSMVSHTITALTDG
jgi:hypothetical protein